MEAACLLGKRKPVFWIMVNPHLSGPVDSKFKATADNIKTDTNKPMKHAFKEGETHSNKYINPDTLHFILRNVTLEVAKLLL